MRHTVTGLALSLALFAFVNTALAEDNGLITEQSRYSVKETVARFEAAVKEKESLGFMVFTEIDHAAAAKKFGLEMRPRTVIVFGNPKLGTPVMVNTPTLAIDVPPNAIENDQLLMTLRALPFAEGYEGKLTTVVGQNVAKIDTTVRIRGREQVTVPAGSFEAWKVELDFGQAKQQAWYQAGAPNNLVQYDNGTTKMVLRGA
jgi:uncharacterized protein (DUF302 family)